MNNRIIRNMTREELIARLATAERIADEVSECCEEYSDRWVKWMDESEALEEKIEEQRKTITDLEHRLRRAIVFDKE
jgi:hypothetical protein